MKLRQISAPKLFLAAILALFIAKGIVLSFLVPIFQNPDEQVHYGTIQHWAEPAEKTWEVKKYEESEYKMDVKDIRTSNLPEETAQNAYLGKFNEITFEKQNTQDFSDETIESQILGNNWKRYVDTNPSTVSGTKSVYYLASSWLERIFSDESIFVRMFSMRMLAVLFGLGVVLLAYLTARKVGFSENISLLLTMLVAFQPMLSATAAQVNIDIALIFSFTLFLYLGIRILKDGLGWGNASLAILASGLGVASKGPGIVLVGALYPLFAWGAYRKYGMPKKKFFVSLAVVTVALAGLALLVVPKGYFAGITNASAQSKFDSPIQSVGKYLDKTLRQGELRDTALSYWGNFGWLDTPIPGWTLSVITWIEIIGFSGVAVYLFFPFFNSRFLDKLGMTEKSWIAISRSLGILRFAQNDKEGDGAGWLPERKYLVFFLVMILALQFAIRFYDWRVFDATGQVLIGQPGRYFLPNLVGHLILVVTGIGFLVSLAVRNNTRFLSANWRIGMTSGEKAFETAVKILALGMILLQIYAIVGVIIPRYYL